MCFDDDARPPIPVTANTGATGRDLTLTSPDGTTFAAYLAQPGSEAESQIVILPDVRGLHNFYRELAMRFAESGKRALAIDYFGRTASDTNRAEPFEFWPHVEKMTQETFELDLQTAVNEVRYGHSDISTFTIGFCYGGSLSLWAGTRHLSLAGVIGFYAGSRRMGARTPLIEWAARIECPVLGLFGGADQSIPQEEVEAFRTKLEQASIPNEIVVYPGAPHSFFDRNATEFTDASADAWMRVQNFIADPGLVSV